MFRKLLIKGAAASAASSPSFSPTLPAAHTHTGHIAAARLRRAACSPSPAPHRRTPCREPVGAVFPPQKNPGVHQGCLRQGPWGARCPLRPATAWAGCGDTERWVGAWPWGRGCWQCFERGFTWHGGTATCHPVGTEDGSPTRATLPASPHPLPFPARAQHLAPAVPSHGVTCPGSTRGVPPSPPYSWDHPNRGQGTGAGRSREGRAQVGQLCLPSGRCTSFL